MRGNSDNGINPTAPPDAVTSPQPKAATAGDQGTSTIQQNMQGAKTPGSAWFWLGLVVLYFVWDYFQNKKGIKESLEPRNIRANAHNIILITLAAVIGLNGTYVLLAKLASMSIPGVSKAAGTLLPLFSV